LILIICRKKWIADFQIKMIFVIIFQVSLTQCKTLLKFWQIIDLYNLIMDVI